MPGLWVAITTRSAPVSLDGLQQRVVDVGRRIMRDHHLVAGLEAVRWRPARRQRLASCFSNSAGVWPIAFGVAGRHTDIADLGTRARRQVGGALQRPSLGLQMGQIDRHHDCLNMRPSTFSVVVSTPLAAALPSCRIYATLVGAVPRLKPKRRNVAAGRSRGCEAIGTKDDSGRAECPPRARRPAKPADQALTSTTTRPLTWPLRISAPSRGRSASVAGCIIASSLSIGRSLAIRFQARSRLS